MFGMRNNFYYSGKKVVYYTKTIAYYGKRNNYYNEELFYPDSVQKVVVSKTNRFLLCFFIIENLDQYNFLDDKIIRKIKKEN